MVYTPDGPPNEVLDVLKTSSVLTVDLDGTPLNGDTVTLVLPFPVTFVGGGELSGTLTRQVIFS